VFYFRTCSDKDALVAKIAKKKLMKEAKAAKEAKVSKTINHNIVHWYTVTPYHTETSQPRRRGLFQSR